MRYFKKKIFGKTRHIHFTGIGGSGMCGIAEVVLTLGFNVTGSDLVESEAIVHLRRRGAKIVIGHKAGNVEGSDVLVFSSAINPKNPEILYAKENEIPVIPRAEMLAEIMRLKRGIAVAGTHGKTTTTSLVGSIFDSAGYKPTVVIGGKFFNIKSNARLGKGRFLICEADESDGSLLKLAPEFSIVTNIDDDHLDYHGTFENLKNIFLRFINRIPFYGFAVVCKDDEHINAILDHAYKKVITYGFKKDADYQAKDIRQTQEGITFAVMKGSDELGELKLKIYGRHNVSNTLAAAALCMELGIPFRQIRKGLAKFQGVERRLELIGEVNGVRVFDDYGHHPTEIRATLDSVPGRKGKLIIIFQPHRYSRTKLLHNKFKDVFSKADHVFITEIYAAGEKPMKGVSARLIFNSVKRFSKSVKFYPVKEDVIDDVVNLAERNDTIVTLGAGDIKNIAPVIIEKLRQKKWQR
ncbi:MAG: UDP-N-acetylmuramate--L-alanine ligase [Spirochaetes bacterium]|nr:UDP-N-acetylmuramate--L-alanine ligase [Spirochaetota bacterium]